MNADDRILLLDLENLGTRWLRQRPFRARLNALLAAADPVHHAVAAYAVSPDADDGPLASLLAELRIAPMPVQPGPDAAELALLAHARRVHIEGGRSFVVGSADGRFAELASLGRVELLVWDGQPVAAKLADVVHHIHRLPRPTGAPDDIKAPEVPESDQATASPPRDAPRPRRHRALAERLLVAVATGVGVALGNAVTEQVLRQLIRRR
jgi:hypothetical protein